MFGFFKKLLSGEAPAGNLGVDELARRLGMSADQLRAVAIVYHKFQLPKRSGGTRTIAAPDKPLKLVQRTILRKLLAKLKSHPAATGFEKGYSIVSNATVHVGGREVVHPPRSQGILPVDEVAAH